MSGLVITVVERRRLHPAGGLDRETLRDIAAFFQSLNREREFLRTRREEALRAEMLLLARLDGALAGMIGVVRRFCIVPCTFVVVRSEYQRRGIARALYEARRRHGRRFGVMFSIVLAGNAPGRDFFREAGEELLADDGRYLVFAAASSRRFRCLYPLFRRLLPTLLRLGHGLARRRNAATR